MSFAHEGKLRENPHNVKMNHIREGLWESREAREPPPPRSVRSAWYELKRAVWKRIQALPCRWLFHVPYHKHHPYSGTTYCKRCGAWRGCW